MAKKSPEPHPAQEPHATSGSNAEAVAIAKLLAEGRLPYDDPVDRYLDTDF